MSSLKRTSGGAGLILLILIMLAGCAMHPRSYRRAGGPPPRPSVKSEAVPPVQAPVPEPPSPLAAKPLPEPPRPKPFVHTVRYRGETLTAIAAWYTGSGRNWERLMAANPGLNPRQMPIGADVRIPEKILVQRRPMPQPMISHPAAKGPAKAGKAVQPAQPTAQVIEPIPVELFGPIDQPLPAPKPADSGLPKPLEPLE